MTARKGMKVGGGEGRRHLKGNLEGRSMKSTPTLSLKEGRRGREPFQSQPHSSHAVPITSWNSSSFGKYWCV